jgi:NTP pyrophosphatase (non-canonical NTP hydrolase)
MKQLEKEIYQKALDKWGSELQIKVAIEECAELIKELAKYGRKVNGSDTEKIAEEIADVEIMLEQMKFLFMIAGRVELLKEVKLERVERLLNDT